MFHGEVGFCGSGARRGAYLLCRLPALPLACFSAPLPRRGRISPQPPSPAGKGVTKVISCKGLRPLHPRGLNPRGTGKGSEPRTRRGVCLVCRPPTPPLVYFFAPIPPAPFPGGEGGDSKIILPGASPPAPRHLTVCGTYRPCHTGAGRRWDEASPAPGGACPRRCRLTLPLWYSQGGLSFWSPADPAFCFPFCPLPRRGRIDPRGRGDPRTCAVGKSARTGICVAGRTCNNRRPLLTIAAEYGTITHRKNPKRGGIR